MSFFKKTSLFVPALIFLIGCSSSLLFGAKGQGTIKVVSIINNLPFPVYYEVENNGEFMHIWDKPPVSHMIGAKSRLDKDIFMRSSMEYGELVSDFMTIKDQTGKNKIAHFRPDSYHKRSISLVIDQNWQGGITIKSIVQQNNENQSFEHQAKKQDNLSGYGKTISFKLQGVTISVTNQTLINVNKAGAVVIPTDMNISTKSVLVRSFQNTVGDNARGYINRIRMNKRLIPGSFKVVPSTRLSELNVTDQLIFALGPNFSIGNVGQNVTLLQRLYLSILNYAENISAIESIAFAPFSTGAYKGSMPLDSIALWSVQAITYFIQNMNPAILKDIKIYCYSIKEYNAFVQAINNAKMSIGAGRAKTYRY